MSFKTDYKDDIYSGNRKYIQVVNDDGTMSFVDATTYEQQGDYFGANELNSIGVKLNNVDSQLGEIPKFQTAGGTGTAITLTGLDLVDGNSKTFVISANNCGVATTINGKPLYKPNTTTAPTLTAGKAVTIWYNLAGDRFFIKASAEGDVVAAQVLAGKTFSNDNDTGLVGEMVRRTGGVSTGYEVAISTFAQSNRLHMYIPKGAYIDSTIDGATTGSNGNPGVYADDVDFTSSNILSTANIFGKQGSIPVKTSDVSNSPDQFNALGTSVGAYSGDGAVNYAYLQIPDSTFYPNGIRWARSPQPDLLPQNILQGKSIFGHVGTAKGGDASLQTRIIPINMAYQQWAQVRVSFESYFAGYNPLVYLIKDPVPQVAHQPYVALYNVRRNGAFVAYAGQERVTIHALNTVGGLGNISVYFYDIADQLVRILSDSMDAGYSFNLEVLALCAL